MSHSGGGSGISSSDGRSFVVTNTGTIERMIQGSLSTHHTTLNMKVVIPKTSSDAMKAHLTCNAKYTQSSTANSVNLRDFTEPYVQSKSKGQFSDNSSTFSLRAWT
jgi:hypothetical protein